MCKKKEKNMRCATCQVYADATEFDEPCVCIWFMDNVVCGNKSVDDCPVYEPLKGENK